MWNSKYSWRQVGQLPVFPDLARAAASLGYREASTWDPFGFVDACQRALGKGDQEEEGALPARAAGGVGAAV